MAKHRKAKAERKESEVRVRLTDAQKGMFVKAAAKTGLDLSAWIRFVMLREID